MSESSVEVCRRAYEAFNRGDVDAWLECFDPDVVYYAASTVDAESVIHGREQLWKALETYAAEFEEFRVEVEHIGAGDRVLSVTTWRGVGPASGVPVELQELIVFVVRDGKIIEGRAFASRDDALQAAGLQTQPGVRSGVQPKLWR